MKEKFTDLQEILDQPNEETQLKFLKEKQKEIIGLFEEILRDSGQVNFTFQELLESFKDNGYSFAEVVLDILDTYNRQGADDWTLEDAIMIGVIELGGEIDLS
ncbi:MAG: hypothetical protein ABII10_00025 [Candidatus Paceibacterota bacterium]